MKARACMLVYLRRWLELHQCVSIQRPDFLLGNVTDAL